MTKGILFYSNNADPITPFTVAAHTLLKHYDGNIHIVFGPTTPQFFLEIMESQSRITYSRASQRYTTRRNWGHRRQEWMEKPHIISKESPFDLTLYYDCDHTYHKKIDVSVFDQIEEKGLVTAMGLRKPNKHYWILKELEAQGDVLDDYYKVNGGCVGYKKGHEAMNIWLSKMEQYKVTSTRKLARNSEEFALGYTINKGFGGRIDENLSICLTRHEVEKPLPEEAIGCHYVGCRWVNSLGWAECLKDAYLENFLGLQEHFDEFKNVSYLRVLLKRINVI